jgi:hypothetical protein
VKSIRPQSRSSEIEPSCGVDEYISYHLPKKYSVYSSSIIVYSGHPSLFAIRATQSTIVVKHGKTHQNQHCLKTLGFDGAAEYSIPVASLPPLFKLTFEL